MARAAAGCASSCRWPKCTGRADTHYTAHRCAFALDVELDPHPCAWCSAPAVHLFRAGWLCIDHAPEQPTPDPQLTAVALASRDQSVVYPHPLPYGPAR